MKKFFASMIVDLFFDTLLVMGLIISLLSMLFSMGFIISIAVEPTLYDTFLGVFSTSASISLFFACLVFLGTFFKRKKSGFKKVVFNLSTIPFAFYIIVLSYLFVTNI